MLVTIFTPVYNREKSIRAVYESLLAQTNKDFEWLVMNDGSTDSTDEIIHNIIAHHDDSFPIRYVKKENEGLSRTINKAIDIAEGTLLMRLDSDDVALPEAVALIHGKYPSIKDNSNICAMAFLSLLYDGSLNGFHPFKEERAESIVDYRHIYHGIGDRNEVMKLEVYRYYKYPEIPGEKFCSEGVVWDRIAQKYKFLYIPHAIYKKGFDEDTITADIYRTLKTNCRGTSLLYSEIIQNFSYLPYKERLLFTIKYYRYAFYAKFPIFKGIPFKLWIIGLPLGIFQLLRDRIEHPEAFK